MSRSIVKRERQLSPISFSIAPNQQYTDLKKDGHARFLKANLMVTLNLAGGAASGTVKVLAPSPLNLIGTNMALEFQPEIGAGSRVPIPAALAHFFTIKAFRRLPEQTALSSGAAGDYTPSAEMTIPLALVDSLYEKQSLLDMRGRSAARLVVDWPTSAANARDELLNGNDRTATFTGTELRVVQVDDLESGIDPDFHAVYKWMRMPHTQTGRNQLKIPLAPDEMLRSICGIVVDNTVRTDSWANGSNQRLTLTVGTDLRKEFRFAELQRRNATQYQIAQSSWPTGFFIVDLDEEGDLEGVARTRFVGEEVVLEHDSGATAPTSASYTDCLVEIVKLTPSGIRRFAK